MYVSRRDLGATNGSLKVRVANFLPSMSRNLGYVFSVELARLSAHLQLACPVTSTTRKVDCRAELPEKKKVSRWLPTKLARN